MSREDVAIKPDWSPVFPILIVVGFNAWPAAQPAEEEALSGIDHDADVSLPDRQIAGLRLSHSLKIIGAAIEIGRTGIRVGEAGPLVDGVDEVGTIAWASSAAASFECRGKYRQAVVLRQCDRAGLAVVMRRRGCAGPYSRLRHCKVRGENAPYESQSPVSPNLAYSNPVCSMQRHSFVF